MKKKKWLFFVGISFLMLLMIGCLLRSDPLEIKKTGEVPGKIIYLYSHPYGKPGEIVWVKEGNYEHHMPLNDAPLASIQLDDDKTPVIASDHYFYRLTADYKVKKKEAPEETGSVLKFKILEGAKISSHAAFNNIDAHILNYEDKNQHFHQQIKGFLSEFAKEGNTLYIFAELIAENKSVMYVIDIPSQKMTKTVPLPEGIAEGMTIFQNKVVIGTEKSLTLVDRSTWKVSTLKLSFPETRPASLYVRDNYLYVAGKYEDLTGLKLIKFDANFNEVDRVDLKQLLTDDQFKDDKYYVAEHNVEHKENGGTISVYQLDTWKKLGQLTLPFAKSEVASLGSFVVY